MDDRELIPMTGFKLIREMSREELIDEILMGNRMTLEGADDETLKTHVVNLRLTIYRRNILKEAGLTEGPFGITAPADE